MGTITPFLSANKKDPISAKMNPRAQRSNVASSASGGGVDNCKHNHRKEIVTPLIASAGGMTPSNSAHNAATSNPHVPVTVGPCIRSPRRMATSCKVIVISPTGTWNVCVSGRHLLTSEVISGQSIAMWPKQNIP